MNDKNDWIVTVVAIVVIAVIGFGCAAKAPCSWYDNTPNKDVPNRCARR